MSEARNTPANDRVVARNLAHLHPNLTPVDPEPHFVAVSVAGLSLVLKGAQDRQLRYGQAFDVLDMRDGYAFGVAPTIDYCGWVPVDALTPSSARASAEHRVCVRQTHAYRDPDLKSPARLALPHLAELCASGEANGFIQTDAGWVPKAHLSDGLAADPVSVAGLYLGADYLWGGNSVFGIDCSGLIQAAAQACGLDCPADSDQQAHQFGGQDLDSPAKRGDLIFWKGHVALVWDAQRLIHANAHTMSVAHEPISAAIERIAAAGDGPVTARGTLA